jgi:hypothetical protein
MYKPFLLLLLIIPVPLLAQEKKLEVDFKSPKGAMVAYDTYSFVSKERDKVCILAVGNTVIRGYILTKDYVLLKEFEGAKPPTRRVLVGGYFRDDKIHYLLARNEDDDEIDYYTYDPATDINISSSVNLEIKKSMFLGGLSLGDQFLFVTVKKSGKIKSWYIASVPMLSMKCFSSITPPLPCNGKVYIMLFQKSMVSHAPLKCHISMIGNRLLLPVLKIIAKCISEMIH